MTKSRQVADFGAGGFTAGKNKIINGDFAINQRAFTSNTTAGAFNFDRWYQINSGGSFTVTPQTFTLGAAPVAGYEGKTYLQGVTASQSAAGDYAIFIQTIEGVRNFAGQTVTISFWAKANTGTPKIAVEMFQYFGTGGSPSASVNNYAGQATLSTSWARYSLTVAIPSISGKTVGTNNNDYLALNLWTSAGSTYNTRTDSLGVQNFTAHIWGVQVEAGNVATPFTTATGTAQGELAACQRYYYLHASGTTVAIGSSAFYNADYCYGTVNFPVTMRITPTLIMTSGTNYYICSRTGGYAYFDYFNLDVANKSVCHILRIQASSGTSGVAGILFTNNASSSMAFNAEL